MGYNIYIGKKIFDEKFFNKNLKEYINDGYSQDDAKERAYIFSLSVKDEYLENAPAFGEPTDYTNSRLPGYQTWHNFVNASGIFNLFYGKHGAFKNHPGEFLITYEWLEQLNKKYKRFKMQYKGCISSFEDNAVNSDKKIYVEDGYMTVNHVLCRFEWLVFWCNYAFNNYGNDAIIYNS